MYGRSIALVPAVLLGTALGCSGSRPPSLGPQADAGAGSDRAVDGNIDAPSEGGGGGPDLQPLDAPPILYNDELYDPARLPRFDIELPQASIDALNRVTGPSDPRQDVYVRGTFRYGTETVVDVGVRIKGEASFRKLNRKAPFKIKFDEFVPNQSFRGLRRLTLNNMVEDPSFLAERLAFHFFRLAMLPAPRCNNALVYVNGTLFGVYANVEAEDKPFLRRWFQNDEGNLYEEGQKDFVPGAETAFNLETNELLNDRSDLKNLISVFQSATPATFLADLDTALDMTHFLRFTAAEAAVNQWDMYAYTVFYPNNFRIYRDPVSRKFVFLPWGMDMSMKPYRDSGKRHIRIFELARQYDRPSGTVTAGLMFQGCLGSPACRTAYTAAVREIVGIYEGAGLEALAVAYHDQIWADVLADPRKEYTMAEVEAGYRSLLDTIRGRPAAIRADIGP